MTEQEKVILHSIDPKFKYIARDENGDLYVYENEPERQLTIWNDDACGYVSDMIAFNHLFKSVSWEDEAPTLIADLLQGGEIDEI